MVIVKRQNQNHILIHILGKLEVMLKLKLNSIYNTFQCVVDRVHYNIITTAILNHMNGDYNSLPQSLLLVTLCLFITCILHEQYTYCSCCTCEIYLLLYRWDKLITIQVRYVNCYTSEIFWLVYRWAMLIAIQVRHTQMDVSSVEVNSSLLLKAAPSASCLIHLCLEERWDYLQITSLLYS